MQQLQRSFRYAFFAVGFVLFILMAYLMASKADDVHDVKGKPYMQPATQQVFAKSDMSSLVSGASYMAVGMQPSTTPSTDSARNNTATTDKTAEQPHAQHTKAALLQSNSLGFLGEKSLRHEAASQGNSEKVFNFEHN